FSPCCTVCSVMPLAACGLASAACGLACDPCASCVPLAVCVLLPLWSVPCEGFSHFTSGPLLDLPSPNTSSTGLRVAAIGTFASSGTSPVFRILSQSTLGGVAW